MNNLYSQLQALCDKDLQDIWQDDFDESKYAKPQWMLAYDIPTTPNTGILDDINSVAGILDDINSVYLQDGIIENDVNLLVEYYDDTTNEYGTGIITSWRKDVYIGEENTERAVIALENGSTDYILEENILPICEVINHEPATTKLPSVPDTVTNSSNGNGTPHHALLLESQVPAAALSSAVAS